MLLTKQLLAFRPSKFDLIFACKTFFAAMVALYIAFLLDLPYPMWAIGTVFIIASPYAGMVSSKALYRLMGTFAGASIAVFVTPYLINTPILFTFILALWTAFCLYISMLDRTPRSYMFMLAGYTSVMVVCNAINSIETTSIFDIALGRVLEISIAVVVSAVVFSTIFPVHMGTAIQQRVNKALKDTELAFQQLFSTVSPSNDSTSQSDEIVKLLSIINRDTNDIHGLAVHLAYEKGELKGMTKPLQEMLHQFSLVIMNMVAMSERLNQLDKIQPELRVALQPLAEISSAFIKQHYEHGSQLTALPHNIEQAFNAVEQGANSTHAKVVLASLKMDLRHFIQNVSTVKLIWALIRQGDKKIPDSIVPLTTKYPSLHRDHGVALRGGLAAFVSVAVGFGLWIFSGWQYGYMMVQMAAVVACILTALDNPIPTLKVFLRGTLYATIIVFVYLFFILPDVKTFWQLALVLAPVMIYAVCLIPHPPLTGLGLPVSINVIMALNLQNHYQVSPVPSIDAALAGLVGPIIPVLALYYIRAISPDMSAKRLLAAHYQAMQDAIHLPFGNQFKVHLRSMIDRIGLLNTKLVESADIKQSMQDALVETSASIDLARLSELAQHPNTPVTIRSDIHMFQQQLSAEFSLQEQNFTGQKQQQDQIIQALNNLREHSLALDNQDLQQRLWMSVNNIRYSICHEMYDLQADNSPTNHDNADAPNQPHQNTPKQNPPQGTAT